MKSNVLKGFYLAPDFYRMEKEYLFMLAFYSENILVSDGFMFWNLLRHGVPILTSLPTAKKQAEQLRSVASAEPLLASTIEPYADLVEAKIIRHEWLASETWRLHIKGHDSHDDIVLFRKFSDRMIARRPAIVEGIVNLCYGKTGINTSDAIHSVRKTHLNEIISEIESEGVVETHQLRRLRRRADEHLVQYIKQEKLASQKVLRNSQWTLSEEAGGLADIVQDCKHNPYLIPAISSEAARFLQELSQSEKNRSLIPPDAKLKQLSQRIGLVLLRKLPRIGFQGVDEVIKFREKLSGELRDFNDKMFAVACDIKKAGELESNIELEIRSKINNELLPTIVRLEKDIEACKPEFGKFIRAAGTGAASAIPLSLMYDKLPLEASLALATGAVSSLADLWKMLGYRKNKISDILSQQEYFGLSLIYKMQNKKIR